MMERIHRLIRLLRTIGHTIGEDDLASLAAAAAYNLLLALFPGMIFIAALAGFIGSLVGVDSLFSQIMAYLRQAMPAGAVEIIQGPLQDVLFTQSSGLLSVGILGALWAASGATASIMQAANRIYGVRETRPFWLGRLLIGVGLTVLLGLLIMAAFLLILFGAQAGEWLAGWVGLSDTFVQLWSLVRWPLIVAALVLALALLYSLAPNVRQPFRWITPGSVVAAVLWLLFTILFGLYVANFGSYNKTYGAIAGVIILILWLNYSAFVVLLGLVVDRVLSRQPPPGTLPPSAPEAATARPGPARPVLAPAWLPLAALGTWTLLILAGALRRGGRDRA